MSKLSSWTRSRLCLAHVDHNERAAAFHFVSFRFYSEGWLEIGPSASLMRHSGSGMGLREFALTGAKQLQMSRVLHGSVGMPLLVGVI